MVSHQNSSCDVHFLTKQNTCGVLCGLKICGCANFSTVFYSQNLYKDSKPIEVLNHMLDLRNTIANFPNMADKNILKM